jgi:hypothetical protein
MSEQRRREPLTNGEREILFQIQQLQAKWIDIVQMCLHREVHHRQRIEELAQNVRDLTQQVQELRQQISYGNQGSLFDRSDSL